jgi:hypothetical protein
MHVYLDNQPLDVAAFAGVAPGGGVSIARALDAARTAAEARGRMIIEVQVDGAALDDAAIEQPADTPSPYREMRLTTADPVLLVRVTMGDAAEALDDARTAQAKAAELLQTGETSDAMQHVSRAVTVWQAVIEVITKSAQLLSLPLEALELKDNARPGASPVRVADLVATLMGELDRLRAAVASDDTSALADLLAYDLADRALAFQGLLRSLADQLESIRDQARSEPPGPRNA